MRNILLVEDDEFVCRTIEIILRKQAYTVTIAKNGQDALQFLKQSTFDLVITDLMLPYANGLELVSKIRHELHLGMPILVLSAVTHEKTVTEGFDIGVDDYLKKPFNPAELTSRVNRLIEQKEKHTL
ncbi:response regulator transcription factor [Chitinophaga nivalis]|uniref:Response regulator transcription factor n=1 Tax=Chitinophaga nivalis TaxID=2991709 RepID=A0ABT3IQH7_9BACT|nr:response regulator transcription factor [Chitinophaga nivalis]MCW3464184.1 response regulator transcription factor [Chitinophaga nivalis]MCW3486126.1 response regulator transcription factor [Chitinophaga nivalis]